MWPFTGPDTEHADTFLSHRFRRQKDPSRVFFLFFVFVFFVFFCSFSPLDPPHHAACGGEGRKPGSVPFMPFTPGASRRQLKAGLNIYLLRLREEHNKMPARSVCVCFLTRQMSSMVPDGQPFVAGSVCPPSVAARQPCGGTEWARRDWSGLRSPGLSAKSRESGANSHPPPRFCPHMLPLHTPTEGVSTQWAGGRHCGEQHRGI